jgi:nucleoside-diphosphate-sugar epimerase
LNHPKVVVVTGATGFLGGTLVQAARQLPGAEVIPIASPRASGVDLAAADTVERLTEAVHLHSPDETLLVHAAARIAWNEAAGLLDNAAMAVSLAKWAAQTGIGFAVLLSSISVSPEDRQVNASAPAVPNSLYGVGKLAAEEAWRLVLPAERRAVIRMAGIWGWQRNASLFWNRLLLAAAGSGGGGRITAGRRASIRNYISVREAAACALGIGVARVSGNFLGAGARGVALSEYVDALRALPGSRLAVEWHDDGARDEVIYEPSSVLRPWLSSFEDELTAIWRDREAWSAGCA